MKHPTQVKIESGHPIFGKVVLAYKHIIKLLIRPYLRNVFDVVVQEYDELENRLIEKQNTLKDQIAHREREFELRFDDAEGKLNSLFNANDRLDEAEGKLNSLFNANDRLDEIERRLIHQNSLNEELIERMDNITIAANREMEESRKKVFNDIKTDILKRTDDLFMVSEQKSYSIHERQEKLDKELVKIKTLEENFGYLTQEILLLKRKLEIILRELKKSIELDKNAKKQISKEVEHIMDHQYFQFENKYRGFAEEIRKRQKLYIPVFDEFKSTNSESYVLDIGCGRGELLELMKENQIPSKGIDINEDMVFVCKEKICDWNY